MEIRNKFEADLLKRIDSDFLAELIGENDDTIDEIVLPKCYTHLFNLLGSYQ